MGSNEVTAFPIAVLLIPEAHNAAVGFAKGVVASLTGNALFTPPPPELATLATDTDAYDKASVAAPGGGKVAVAVRKAARAKVIADLKHICDRVQAVAETQATAADAAAIIVGAGLRIKRVVKRNKPPVRASYGATSGSVVLDALRVAAVAMYFWELSLDQKVWSSAPETMKSRLVVTGLTPGQIYYFRFRAQTRKGPVDYSQIVSLMVH
jgi:hypothetical protein